MLFSSEESRRCECDYPYSRHSDKAKKKYHACKEADVKWQFKKHSEQKMTNAFGEIEFVGYGGNVGKVGDGPDR